MTDQEPVTELGAFSSPDAAATSWDQARTGLEQAEIYWLSTVRPDGQPHVTPLLGIWLNAGFYFSTGADERKAKNLAGNPRCTVTTGVNTLDGVDLVVEGTAATVTDAGQLGQVAATFESKYGAQFTEPDGTWFGLGTAIRDGKTPVWRVSPSRAFAFGKGKVYSQTRYAFG